MTPTKSMTDQLIVLSAFRYALGSESYICGIVRGFLHEHFEHDISLEHKANIVRDLVDYLMMTYPPSLLCDRAMRDEWIAFGQWCWRILPSKQQQYVKDQTAYHKKDWPL